jgi:putative nucleotidyltransferase with HDIG domain
VAALAGEMARCLRLPPAQRQYLDQAALALAGSAKLLQPKALDRLLGDLFGPGPEVLARPGPLPADRPAQAGTAFTEDALRLLKDILEIAACYAQRVEYLPYEALNGEQMVDELGAVAAELGIPPVVVTALASMQRIRLEQLVDRVHRLPVFPRVALRALEMARAEDTSVSAVEKLVSADQVLAGRLIQTANSSLYNPARRIATLRQAIAYVGLEAARRVLMAAVFHPLFASAGLKGLWRHSLEVSQLAEGLAATSRKVSPEETFLAGLVHDVGRLTLATAQGEDVLAYARMLEQGCEPVFAEMVLCGFDHGRAGAAILRFWSFPEHLVQAVEAHHHPEHSDSELAAILYLAEFWSGSDEDLSSACRLRAAFQRTGLTWDDLRNARLRPGSLSELLGSAA